MFKMIRPRTLFLFSGLLFYAAFGDSKNAGRSESEVTEDFKNGKSRTDAEQDPFISVTLSPQPGDPQSALFSSCLNKTSTLVAKFASIEVLGSEYIRYVPDSRQSSVPISWRSMNGTYSSILDCSKAAHDEGWPMFKYNGAKCEVVNTTYGLTDVPKCEDEKSDAVFILSTAVVDCPLPRFFVGMDSVDKAICGIVSKDLMTYDEARSFCLGVYQPNELVLFVNDNPPLTLQDATNSFTMLGYTQTNLWVNAVRKQSINNDQTDWYGNFDFSDWWDGRFPVFTDPNATFRAAYLDKDANFKLRESDKSFKAGALCITSPGAR